MSIQSTINQSLSLASLLVSQTPLAAKSRETAIQEAEIARAGTNVNKAIEAENIALESYEKLTSNPDITDEGIIQSPEYQAYTEAGDRVLAAEEKLMELDPSAETHKKILARRREAGEQREAVEKARKDAQERLALEQERLAASREIVKGISGYAPRDTSAERQEAINYVKTMRGKK